MAAKRLSHARYVLVNRLAMPIMAFVTLIVIGRESDALLGEYALVMTFYFIMQMVPLLGLTSYVMREVARRPAEAGRYFSTIGALSMVGCVAVDLVCAGLLRFAHYPAEVERAIAILGVLIFPGIMLFLAEILFMSVQRTLPIAIVAVVENVVRAAASIAAVLHGEGVVALVWIFLVTRAAALVAYVACLRGMGIVERFEAPDPQLLRRTLTVLPAFFVGTVLFAVFSRLDFVVLSMFEPAEVIGYYAVGYRPLDIATLILTALVMAVFPWISRVYARGRPGEFRTAARNIVLLFAAGLGAISVAGVLFAQDYVRILFSRQFPKPVTLTELYMAALLVMGLDYVASSLLHGADRQRQDARAMLFGGLAHLGLLVAWVPPYGIYGAFGAKLTATLVQLAIKSLELRRAFGAVFNAADLARIAALAALVALGTAAVIHAGPAVRALVGIALAFGVLPLAALALGLVQPLRILRFAWRTPAYPDVSSFGGLLGAVAADAREHARRARRACDRGPRMDRRLAATLCYRVGRHLHLNGRRRLARLVTGTGQAATRVPIDPSSPSKPQERCA